MTEFDPTLCSPAHMGELIKALGTLTQEEDMEIFEQPAEGEM